MASKRALARAVGLGAVAGMKSLAALAILSRHASRGGAGNWKNGLDFDRTPFQWLGRPFYSTLLGVVAALEMSRAKVPGSPSRTAPISLALRASAGALAGAAVFAGDDESPLPGAALGAASAVAVAFAAYAIRKSLARSGRVGDKALGVGEDLLVAALGHGLLRNSGR